MHKVIWSSLFPHLKLFSSFILCEVKLVASTYLLKLCDRSQLVLLYLKWNSGLEWTDLNKTVGVKMHVAIWIRLWVWICASLHEIDLITKNVLIDSNPRPLWRLVTSIWRHRKITATEVTKSRVLPPVPRFAEKHRVRYHSCMATCFSRTEGNFALSKGIAQWWVWCGHSLK